MKDKFKIKGERMHKRRNTKCGSVREWTGKNEGLSHFVFLPVASECH